MPLGRWARAKSLLRPRERLVLDAGCAFGFGTAGLLPAHRPVGLERSWDYLRRAHRSYPALPLVGGDVAALPFAAGVFDAVLLLDVLEHLPHPAAAVAEAGRVLKPGGALVVSVPHAGVLAGFDSLNVYAHLAARFGWPPLDEGERGYPEHRHFGLLGLTELLEGFRVEGVQLSGLGLGEIAHLAALVPLRGLLRLEAVYRVARFLPFAISYLDDVLPAGRLSYNLTLRAVKVREEPHP